MSEHQQSDIEDDHISEFDNNIPEQEEDEDVSVQSQESQGRGRPRIQESWTRVISFKLDNLEANHSFIIATDLLLA